ncbi:methyl-accepting chemotaxis protein [Rhodoplanes sp. Z2-YC6860]|uniref:methyl-accepting chemotaxis protein n=1 Tax=Rhodoplanes sp. Z2-YC6860 TaxID=674703 RepID=UPI00082B7A2D|nr:HAMP domain-containing methyl-accepting chemotaxis protein [Rhodoplanes sp. Z2-YC6860]
MPRRLNVSILLKLYAIIALFATATVMLVIVAVDSAKRHNELTAEFEAALQGAQTVERMNSLIYAVVAEARGMFLSDDADEAAAFIARMKQANEELFELSSDHARQTRQTAAFRPVAEKIKKFHDIRKELIRLGSEISPAAARERGFTTTMRENRQELNRELENLGAVYLRQAREVYAAANANADTSAKEMIALSIAAVLLAALSAFLLWRSVARPLTTITRVTSAIANGERAVIPYSTRRDEIGALSRSISVFQNAMLSNLELNRAAADSAQTREQEQQKMSADTKAFAASIEESIVNLSTISDQVTEAAGQLAAAADRAANRTEGAINASSEASANVRDIASAADELAASVMEIDRQVTQSNSITEQAVGEAERTNAAMQELGEAGRRIGDVVRLITDIAEQTNLLALNATIEAARAGEAGRGFAVVAGEVKALAGQTARATDDIAKQIADMQQATLRSIEAISTIARTIRDIGAISGAISAAVTEQGAATQEIARSVDIAARRTADTAEEVSRVDDATENTRTNVMAVRAVAEELGGIAHRIRDQVEEFTLKLRAG